MGQGAAARPAPDGLAGGPRTFSGMAPVPNPGDLSKADRVKFYGHKYDYLPEPKGQTAGASSTGPRFQLVTRRKADGTLQIAMRPVANPEDMSAAERRQVYGNRYAPRAVAAAPRRSWRAAAAPVVKPSVVKVAPPAAVKPASKPVATVPLKPVAPAPVLAPAAPVAVAPKLTPPQQLQAAVSGGINSGATLSVPADLKAGKEADVVLSLPGDLLAMVQEQAAKLGLGKAAKKVDAYASLKGDGYAINPPGQQTAAVAAGKPTTFTWKVKPTEGAKSPLTADYGLELKGVKPKTAFSVGSLKEAVAAPVQAATTAAKGFKLPKLGMPSLKALAFPWVPEPTLPGVGKVARENVVGGALALLALILLVVLARGAGASRARAERRRKFRTMQDYGVNEPEPAHEAHPVTAASQGYVNPMVAAAAGAAGGYALASHGHDDHGHGHDDHGHGHDDHAHGHDDHAAGHGHDDHGHGAQHTSHDAHGHDEHGHGHDDHGQKADDHGHGHDDHGAGHGHDDHGHGHGAHPVASTSHGHDDHGHGHDDHAAGHGHDDGHGHGDGHGHEAPAHGHDDHGHGGHHTTLTSHGHDDHAGHDDHGHGDGHGDGHGHDDGHGHGHDDHGHGPAQHISHTGHDDHGHGHDDHGHKADDHGHGHDDHAHGHGHDEHHKEPEHAH